MVKAEQHAFAPGPHPGSSSAAMSDRMSRVKKRDNGPELAVRRAAPQPWPAVSRGVAVAGPEAADDRHRVHAEAGCCLHRRMLLARVPRPRNLAEGQRGMVGLEDLDQSSEGRGRHGAARGHGLEGSPVLGARCTPGGLGTDLVLDVDRAEVIDVGVQRLQEIRPIVEPAPCQPVSEPFGRPVR